MDVLERIGTALADPTRRRTLTMLLVGPAYPAELAQVLDVSRAKASNHLACVRGCRLVTATREGRQLRYQLADQRLAGALRELTRVVLDSPACPIHLEPGAWVLAGHDSDLRNHRCIPMVAADKSQPTDRATATSAGRRYVGP